MERSRAHLALGSFDSALQGGSDALNLDPRSEKGLLQGGLALYALQYFEQCARYLERLTDAYPMHQIASDETAQTKDVR